MCSARPGQVTAQPSTSSTILSTWQHMVNSHYHHYHHHHHHYLLNVPGAGERDEVGQSAGVHRQSQLQSVVDIVVDIDIMADTVDIAVVIIDIVSTCNTRPCSAAPGPGYSS